MNVLTAHKGTNADLFAIIGNLYFPKPGAVVADVTFGKGVFWSKMDTKQWDFRPTDLATGVDCRTLPYADGECDLLVFDPPYMHGGKTVKASINRCYNNDNGSHASIIRLYLGGLLEAYRVVKRQGIVLVKTQDEIESGKQRWSHIEVMQGLQLIGFHVVDMFVLKQNGIPTMRESYQKSARKNHSYLLVGRKP